MPCIGGTVRTQSLAPEGIAAKILGTVESDIVKIGQLFRWRKGMNTSSQTQTLEGRVNLFFI